MPLVLLLLPFLTIDALADRTQIGHASWYAMTSMTASGERANPNAMVAAHKRLPFGTCLRVTNLKNGRTVTVRINDRGPFVKGRVLDLSREAASRLGFVRAGSAKVSFRPVEDDC